MRLDLNTSYLSSKTISGLIIEKGGREILNLIKSNDSHRGHYDWIDAGRVELSGLEFSEGEYEAALKRYCKRNQLYHSVKLSELRDAQELLKAMEKIESYREEIPFDRFSPFTKEETQSFWKIFLKTILAIAFPGMVYSEEYCPYSGGRWERCDEIMIFADEIKAEIYEDLLIRKVTTILKDAVSRVFKTRHLLFVQSHLREILFEYFDIVFSFKEKIVVRLEGYSEFLTQQIFYNFHGEKQYHRIIPITCRT